MRKFPSPNDVGYGLNVPYIHIFNRVEDHLKNHQFRFEVPFGGKKWFNEIQKALRDQGWNVVEHNGEKTEWEIKVR